MTIQMYGYFKNDKGVSESRPVTNKEDAQRAVFYFDDNKTDAKDTTAKQAFQDKALIHGFAGQVKLSKDENAWLVEKSTTVNW